MRHEVLEYVKKQLTKSLSDTLRAEGITLYIAANDNIPDDPISVTLEQIEANELFCDKLVSEIRVLLGIVGKSSHCDALMELLYSCLHPCQLSLPEVNVLLMSMYVESSTAIKRRPLHKKAVMRYILEES